MNAAVPAKLARSNRDRVMITPEGIALPITVASKGARAGALILDLIFITLLMIGTTIALISIAGGAANLTKQLENTSAAASALEFLIVIWIITMFLFRNAYFLFFELGPRGATPGKRMAGIRIAARDGGRLGVDMVIARNLLRDIELFLPIVFLSSAGDENSGMAGIAAAAWFLLFALFPFFNRDRLRAGDIIAGSWVVEAPKRKLEAAMTTKAQGREIAHDALERFLFTDEELAVYGEYEVQTLERVLRENRKEALAAVHETICRKIGRDPAASAGQERAFLGAYYTQLRARLEGHMRMGRRKADKFTEAE